MVEENQVYRRVLRESDKGIGAELYLYQIPEEDKYYFLLVDSGLVKGKKSEYLKKEDFKVSGKILDILRGILVYNDEFCRKIYEIEKEINKIISSTQEIKTEVDTKKENKNQSKIFVDKTELDNLFKEFPSAKKEIEEDIKGICKYYNQNPNKFGDEETKTYYLNKIKKSILLRNFLFDSTKEKEDYPNKKKERKTSSKSEIILPKTGKLISHFAIEISNVLKGKNILFFRDDSREVVEIGNIKNKNEQVYMGFISVKPNRFITLIERFLIPGVIITVKKEDEVEYIFKQKSITADLSNTILQSKILEESLPHIHRIFTVPIPIIHKGKLTFPKKGYDKRFKSWLSPHSPKIMNPYITLEKGKLVLSEILKEFCFKSKYDLTQAIAGLITPFLRGLYSKFNSRTPIFFYLSNRERVGKDYLAGITGLVYEGISLEEPPICNSERNSGSNEELKKKILSTFIAGRKRLHFANNKGYLNNAVLEAISTAPQYSDRLLGKNESPIFDNELEISLSGNVGVGFTPDLANRSRFIKLFLDIEDANSRKFEKPDLHKWILENRELIISAIYSLIRNWFKCGCPNGSISFTSFPEWARVCGGIMEAAGYESPCKPSEEIVILGGDSETTDMKKLFEICYEKCPNKAINKAEIKELIKSEGDIFAYLDFDKRSDQVKFGNKIIKFIGRILSNIRMYVEDSSVRSARQQYIFTKIDKKIENQRDLNSEYGNHGNIGNNHRPVEMKAVNNIYKGSILPSLPTLPTFEVVVEKIGENSSYNLKDEVNDSKEKEEIPKEEKDNLSSQIKQAISLIEDRIGKLIPLEEIYASEKLKSYSKEEINQEIDKLKASGEIFMPREGYVQKI